MIRVQLYVALFVVGVIGVSLGIFTSPSYFIFVLLLLFLAVCVVSTESANPFRAPWVFRLSLIIAVYATLCFLAVGIHLVSQVHEASRDSLVRSASEWRDGVQIPTRFLRDDCGVDRFNATFNGTRSSLEALATNCLEEIGISPPEDMAAAWRLLPWFCAMYVSVLEFAALRQ